MRSPQSVFIPLAIAAGGVAVFWWSESDFGGTPSPAGESNAPARPAPTAPHSRDGDLASAFDRLPGRTDRAGSEKRLAELRTILAAMPQDEAVSRIRAFLASRQDKETGFPFEISGDGNLKEWTTSRTFLLDSISAINPAVAAEISREILASPTTADEWALALRNVGRVEQGDETSAFLRERAESLIRNPAWQAKPSVGYLNAFDVLVHTRATASTPLLSDLVQMKDRRDLAHAAFLTLDRLVQREPVAELGLLAADRALHQSRPEMTAQQFARADLRDPAQQAVVKSWLLDPARTPVELQSFAGVYPNNNRFVSNNLLTADSSPAGAELAAHDRQVLEIVNGWLADPAFQPRTDTLRTMAGRLQQFTERKPEALGTGDR